jgi:hypothetical protein
MNTRGIAQASAVELRSADAMPAGWVAGDLGKPGEIVTTIPHAA